MNRRFAVEAFKFGVYLAIPVFAYAYFNDPDRVARFVKRFIPKPQTPPEERNTIPRDIIERLARGEDPDNIIKRMQQDRQIAEEKRRKRLEELERQLEKERVLREQARSVQSE